MPAYNAENTILELLKRISKINEILKGKDVNIKQLLIVNDGSKDNTLGILTDFKKKHTWIEIVDKKNNEGPVSALFDGMKYASDIMVKQGYQPSKTILIRMDSDLEHQPEDIPKLIEPIIAGKTNATVGYIPFDSRSGFLTNLFNEHIGLSESKGFLDMEIPQFCPGFNAIRGDVFGKAYPELVKKAEEFRKKYGKDMLTLDFVILVLVKKYEKNMDRIKLRAIEDRYIKKPSFGKLLLYFRYHNENVNFLKNF